MIRLHVCFERMLCFKPLWAALTLFWPILGMNHLEMAPELTHPIRGFVTTDFADATQGCLLRAHSMLLPLVSLEDGLAGKTLVACIAGEVTPTPVILHHVVAEIALAHEGFPATLAEDRFLARVRAEMELEVVALHVPLLAKVTV
jgi:hypothetical protein